MIRKSKAATAVVGVFCSSLLLLAPAVSQAGIKIQNAAYDLASKDLVVKAKLDGVGDYADVTLADAAGNLLGSARTGKQVLFYVPYDSVLDVPCEIILTVAEGAETEQASSEVKNCPGPGQTFELILSGIVTDEPIPFATVSVTLDGVTYTTTADEFGNYQLPILSSNLNQLLRIDASATDPETGDPIDFVSLSGTFARALDGESSGNVTNVTTASYILTVEANGGQEPTTAEELATAETSVDATELFQLAALIKLIVDDPQYRLPEGETSLIGFISNPEAVEAYVATVPQEDLDAALAEILNDSNLVAGFTAAEIPERYYAIPVASPGFIARNGSGLEFDPAGTGTFLGLDGNSGQPVAQTFSWSIDAAGRLVVELDAPIVSTNFPTKEDTPATPEELVILEANNIKQIQEIRTISRYTYTRVTDGTLVDIVQVETREVITYPDIPLAEGSLTLATSEVVDIGTSDSTFRSSLDIEPTPFSATCNGQAVCAVGVWGGAFHYTVSPGTYFTGYVYPPTAYGDLMTLAGDGSASGTLGSASATWSIDAAGALVIHYAEDGWTQRMEILDELNGEYGIFSDYTNGSERFATYTVYSRADTKPVLSDSDVINFTGRYYNGEVNSWIPGSFQDDGLRVPDRRFGWQFDEGGTGRQFAGYNAEDCGGAGLAITPMTWAVATDGSVEFTYPWFVNQQGNTRFRIRNWYAAAEGTIDGDRVYYVVEVDRAEWGQLVFAPRLNIEREIPLQGDYCQTFNAF